MSQRTTNARLQTQSGRFTPVFVLLTLIGMILFGLFTAAASLIGQQLPTDMIVYKGGTNETVLYLVDVNRQIAQPSKQPIQCRVIRNPAPQH